MNDSINAVSGFPLFISIVIPLLLSLGVLYGIKLMSNVKTAVRGNRVSALCMLLAIVYVFFRTDLAGSWSTSSWGPDDRHPGQRGDDHQGRR